MRIRSALALAALFALCAAAQAQDSTAGKDAEIDKFVQSLHFQSGTINLPQAKAALKLQGDTRFLDGRDAKRVLTELWGNPPGDEPLGMVLPSAQALTDDKSFAVVVTYNDDGYV